MLSILTTYSAPESATDSMDLIIWKYNVSHSFSGGILAQSVEETLKSF